MSSLSNCKISAIISSEKRLEKVIHRLIQHAVARHDISVQGPPSRLNQSFAQHHPAPNDVQDSSAPPKKEAYLADDFGWLISFAFSIPMVIGLIVGIFIIGDVRSVHDNIRYGLIGLIAGGAIGFVCALTLKKHHDKAARAQEKKGGYVMWVTVNDPAMVETVVDILTKFKAKNVTVE